jgi:diguanylate cyclase (GGDEF)-like protein/PAS domain S-box-containing protein
MKASMFRNRLPFTFSMPAALTLISGLASTAVLFAVLRTLEHDAMVADFTQRANLRMTTVKQGFNDALAGVETVNRLFMTVGAVSRSQFSQYTQPLLLHYPCIQSFAFYRYVDANGRSGYETAMRKQYPGFSLQEQIDGKLVSARTKETYLIRDYVEAKRDASSEIGLDVSQNPDLADVMQHAIATGVASSTKLIPLEGLADSRRGFMVVVPVYRHGAEIDTAASRRIAVIGNTAALFSVDEIIDRVPGVEGLSKPSDVAMSIYAGESLDEHTLAFRETSSQADDAVASLLPAWLYNNNLKKITSTFNVAGNPWHIEVTASTPKIMMYHQVSLVTLIGGILFTLLATVYIQTLASRSRRIRRLVDERTLEARRANQLLSEDIAARMVTEKALQLRDRAIEASPNAIIIITAQAPRHPIEYINPAFERITGYAIDEVIGQSLHVLVGEDLHQPGVAEFNAALHDKREGHAIFRSYKKDGTMFWSDVYIAPVKDMAGELTHFVVSQYDITAMKRYEAELEFQTNQDTLTGLANRNLLRDRLSQEIAYADRYGHPVWVVFVDLDHFKFINDTLGHKAGDSLLKTVSERLQSAVRETDTVARLGGDEFVLVLPERTDDENMAMRVIQRIKDSVVMPFKIEEYEFFITCSIGISVYPTDGTDPESLMKHADIAMYRAKEIGRNNSQFYTPTMNERALERLHMEGDLRAALEQDQFELHYQPQVDLRSGKIIGVEALIRWNHPEHGMIAPSRFIALAEETGLIVPIGAWVIRTACAQNKAWQRAGHASLKVAVNLSARQFTQHDLVELIAFALAETKLDPQYLEIELTESMVMADVERAIEILRKLNELGVQISIDDFGTGYSSLSYLKRFPIDVLKVDQSFVRDITIDPDDAAIVASIISLAHSLRLQVIAEGVETAEQLDYLQGNDCDVMQGYHFSRPLPADQLEQMLMNGKCLEVL